MSHVVLFTPRIKHDDRPRDRAVVAATATVQIVLRAVVHGWADLDSAAAGACDRVADYLRDEFVDIARTAAAERQLVD